MSEKIDQIVEELKTLTLLEASELVSQIEETFGVDGNISIGGAIMIPNVAGGRAIANPSASQEDKTKFEIIEISNPNATIHAPSFGLFDRLVKAGDTVSKGQLAGWFHYISEPDRESIKLKFTHSGKILAHSNRGVVDKGEMLALVANDYETKE